MVKKTYELKLVENHGSQVTWNALRMLFIEAKWVLNYLIHCPFVFEYVIKDTILVKVFNVFTQKCDMIEERPLCFLGSHIKQSLVKKVQQDIINLSKAKKKGRKVGALRPISECTSIPLKQFGVTYQLRGNRVTIQNIGEFRVRGQEQIPANAEIAQATLIKKSSGYYLKVLTHQVPQPQTTQGAIGLDKGVKIPVCLSNGIEADVGVPMPKIIPKRHKDVSRTKSRSKNRKHAQNQLAKKYEHWTNQRNDKANKFVHFLKQFSLIASQDDNVAAWKRLWGKKLQETAFGRITVSLERLTTFVNLPKYLPTTKECPHCLRHNYIPLDDREYSCSCGFREHRDVKAAKTALCYAIYLQEHPSQDLRRLTVEERTAVYKIYDFVSISPFVEAVSPIIPAREILLESGEAPDFSQG